MANTRGTAFYVEHLNPKHKRWLENLKDLGKRTGNYQIARAEIRGYLTALNDAEIIGDVEFRCLYTYYTNF